MGFIVREVFPVRGNEIGFTGVISPGTLARYAEWARWAMFRDDTFGIRDRFRSGVARAQTIELSSDFTYPSDCEITSWLARLGRTSFDFGHEMRRKDDGGLVARARVTIVQLGANGPEPMDPSLGEFVEAREAPEPLVPEGEGFEGAYRIELLARPSDQDQFRHVNQAKYVDFADDVRWLAAREGHEAGFEGPLGAISVDYRREVRAGDRLVAQLALRANGLRAFELHDAASGALVHRAALRPR